MAGLRPGMREVKPDVAAGDVHLARITLQFTDPDAEREYLLRDFRSVFLFSFRFGLIGGD